MWRKTIGVSLIIASLSRGFTASWVDRKMAGGRGSCKSRALGSQEMAGWVSRMMGDRRAKLARCVCRKDGGIGSNECGDERVWIEYELATAKSIWKKFRWN